MEESSRAMEDLNYQAEQILQDFEEFERVFLQPYTPKSTDLLCTSDPVTPCRVETRVSWLEEMERNFVHTELCDSIFHSSDFKSEMTDKCNIVSFDSNPLNFRTLKPDNPNSNIMLPNLVEDMPDTSLSVTNPVLFDDQPPFDPAVLAVIDFDFPTTPDKADTRNGEEIAIKVAENMTTFQERKGDDVCCNVTSWGYVEEIWREVQKIPRGRRKKGFDLSPQVRRFCKERQKIKNRISATKCYTRVKAHIHDLEVQVTELQAENKIRRNLVQFLGSSLQLQQRKQSLSRTMSGHL